MRYTIIALVCFAFLVNADEYTNQIVFQETLEYIASHKLPPLEIDFYEGSLNISEILPSNPALVVESKSSFQVAQELYNAGYKPLILDMANKMSPGGSVVRGSAAQEETLCRQSNLYLGLKLANYPLPEKGGLLIKQVTFFRNDLYEFIAVPFQVDVFALAAYDCNLLHKPNQEESLSGYDRPENEQEYEMGTKAKMRSLFRAAVDNGNDSLVLSAFGCGAFQNDPKLITRWYKEVILEAEFADAFKLIVFAIIPSHSANFTIFQNYFNLINNKKEQYEYK